MRVTDNTNFNVVRESINRSRTRMEKLQGQTATMRKINSPSDDPIGAAKVLEIRTDKVNNDQYQMNSRLAETFLINSDHTLSELSDLILRAKEIALSQSNGASANEESRLGIAEEVTQLFRQSVATANRRIGDRYLFGGYKTHQPPVNEDGHYVGDAGETMVEIAKDVFVAVNVHGLEAFNTNPREYAETHQLETRDGRRAPAGQKGQEISESDHVGPENVNVFDELQNLRISLLTGDVGGIRNTLERFDQVHRKLVAIRAKIGSRLQALSNTMQALERHNITNAQLSSALEDADMAQVVSDLAKEETVFRSALSSSQKLVQPTLLDFLK